MLIASLGAAPLGACQPAEEARQVSPAGLEETRLTVTTADGTQHAFTVEIAATPAQQQQGLMFRQELAPDRGMIFPYDPPKDASFWMRNTYIPLDIIFVRADGTIARIAENTVPLSETPIGSLEPVTMVLEIAGGRAAELGIEPGDVVTWQR